MNEQFDPDHWQLHAFEKGTRYYVAYLTQSLFGEWQVERRWVGKRRRGSKSLVMPAATYAEALVVLDGVIKRRQRRGYQEIDAS